MELQTFDPAAFEGDEKIPQTLCNLVLAVRPFEVKMLAGILVLRNAKMAEFMNANSPGVSVPQEMIDELRAAAPEHAEDVGVDIAVRTIKAVRPYCDGVHIMAIKATHRLYGLTHVPLFFWRAS